MGGLTKGNDWIGRVSAELVDNAERMSFESVMMRKISCTLYNVQGFSFVSN